MDEWDTGGRLILDPQVKETLEEIQRKRITIPNEPRPIAFDMQNYKFPMGNTLLQILGDSLNTKPLDPKKGQEAISIGRTLYAYDESIDQYQCIEGSAFITAHSLIKLDKESYLPIGYVTTYFYTRASLLTDGTKALRYSDQIEVESKKDYVLDKIDLLSKYVEDHGVVFIDGPLIGGDVYIHMIKAMEDFEARDIIPVFFVKNSNSNLVVDNIEGLRGRYNSDLHWAHTVLKKGERTNFFCYTDQVNAKNAKVFCYVRLFDGSPQRVEFYVESYRNHRDEIDQIMDTIAYMAVVQGVVKNPQIRLIAIAEQYAREYIKLCDIKSLLRKMSLTPTIDTERF